MKYCPHCGSPNGDDSMFCSECGFKMPETKPAPPQVINVDPPLSAFKEEEKSKPAKEKKVKAPKEKKTKAPKEKKSKKGLWIVLICVLVAAIAAGAVLLALGVFGGEDEQEQPELKLTDFTFRQTAFECSSEKTPVLVLASFDPSVDTSGLTVHAYCKATGEKISMTDDGEGADTLADDNVFYGLTSVGSEEETTLSYTLQVSGGNVKKATATIRFYTMDSYYEERHTIDLVENDLDDLAEDFDYTGDAETDAENYLTTVDEISDHLDTLIEEGAIVSYSFNAPNFLIKLPNGYYVYEFGVGDDGIQSSGSGSGGSYSEDFIAESDLDMLLMLPYDGDLNSAPFENAVEDISGADLGYKDADIRRNSSVNASLMKSLQSYRVIAINTHGGCGDTIGAYFALGISADEISSEDYNNDRLIPSNKGRALITAAFFEHYYEDGSLNDCLIYLGCCHGADNDILARTLIRKGADAVLAYTNSVYSSYDGDMVETLFSALTDNDGDDGKTKTVTAALKEAKEEHGDKDPTKTQWYYFWERVKERDRAELKLYHANSADPFRLVKDGDSGTIAGKVVMAADGDSQIPCARITIRGESSGVSFYTDANGEFTYNLPSGEYRVTVWAEGYYPLNLTTNVYTNIITSLETFLMVREEDGVESGVAAGDVTSAMTGEGLPGVQLTVRKDWNNQTEGEVLATLLTDSSGGYEVELPVGNYTVCAELEGYVSGSFNIVVQAGTTDNQHYVMNMDMENVEFDGTQFRIVLSWGSDPRDMDLHLNGPTADGDRFHVYWRNMSYWENDSQICNLDVDDRYSYGPETVTLATIHPDEAYYCYVHLFTGDGTMGSSGSKVAVYCGSQLIFNLSVPTNADADYWNVFAIVDGRLVINNTVSDSPNTSYAE